MEHVQLPDSVRDERGQAVEKIVARMARIDLAPLLVYRIDTVPAEALPFLGWQFDLLSPLWQLIAPADPNGDADNATAQRRGLIKQGIGLKKLVGTPFAIKTAIRALGWSSVEILEGQDKWGGVSYPSDQGWAVCRIVITLPDLNPEALSAPSWQSYVTSYGPGAIVTWLGMKLYAVGLPTPGLPPAYSEIAEVPPIATLSDMEHLIVKPWVLADWEVGTPVPEGSVELVVEVFEFFKRRSSWLDSVWFVETITDSAPVPRDRLTVSGIADYLADTVPPPADGALAITVTMALAEIYPPIAPLQNNHFLQKGHTQGANEPIVADSVLTINGVAHGESN